MHKVESGVKQIQTQIVYLSNHHRKIHLQNKLKT